MTKADRKKFHAQIMEAVKAGNLDKIIEIVDQGYIFNEDVAEFNPVVNDNQFIYIAVTENQLDVLTWLLEEAGLDPAIDGNKAIKTAFATNDEEAAFELFKHPYVREDIFFECKESLTLPQVKFLLYFWYPVEGADEMYAEFTGDDSEGRFSLENSYEDDELSESYDEDDSMVVSDDSESRHGLSELKRELSAAKRDKLDLKRRQAANPFA